MGARLPDTAAGVMDVGVARFAGLRLRVHLESAEATSLAHVVEGRVVYLDALASTDRVITTQPGALQEMLVLRDQDAPRAFSWHLDRGEGFQHVVARDGALDFVDDHGRAVLSMRRPQAFDAKGDAVAVACQWDESSSALRLTLPDTKLIYPVVVDPDFETSVWTDLGKNHPADRRAQVMAYDTAHAQTVMAFGAIGGLNDTWLWDGGVWTRASPPNVPPLRYSTASAYHAASGRVVLFGGYDFSYRNDTWLWDGATWAQPAAGTTPVGRTSHAMAYDAARAEIVLFGGTTASAVLGETWVWNGTWTQRMPVISPAPRSQPALAFDGARTRTVLFGGEDNGAQFGDTWLWDGAVWTQTTPATSPSARHGSAFAFDAARGRGVLYGGASAAGLLADTWTWDGTTWTLVSSSSPPGPRTQCAMAYDSVRRRTILFGGGSRNDTWEWDGATWQLVANEFRCRPRVLTIASSSTERESCSRAEAQMT